MNEKLIEKKLREGVKQRGGIALKFASPYYTGVPDRIVLMPGGRVSFVELKSTGKKPTPKQQAVIALLAGLGFRTEVIDRGEQLIDYLKSLDHEI